MARTSGRSQRGGGASGAAGEAGAWAGADGATDIGLDGFRLRGAGQARGAVVCGLDLNRKIGNLSVDGECGPVAQLDRALGFEPRGRGFESLRVYHVVRERGLKAWPLAFDRAGALPRSVDFRQIITIEPGKRSGKPCIRGLRITVFDVLDYLAAGMTHAEILAEFPYLTETDIRACLAYAADRERRLAVVGG